MFTENLAAFFQTSDFAVAATWDQAPATPVNGIFDKEYLRQLGLVDGNNPVFVCPAASLPGVAQGQTLTIAGTVYTIAGGEPDGTGLVRVQLEA